MQGIAPEFNLEKEVSDEIQGNIAKQNMDEINADIAKQRAAGFHSSMQVAAQFDPATFAKATQVERESGIPARIAYENMDQVEQHQRKSHLDGIFTDYQTTAKVLSNPSVAILAKNDVPVLTGIERARLEDKFYDQGFFERQIANPAKQWWHRDTQSEVPVRIAELDRIELDFQLVDSGEQVNSPFGREYQAADAAGRAKMRANASLQRNLAIEKYQTATNALSQIPVDPSDIDMADADGVGGVLDVLAGDPMYLGRLFGQSSGDMAQGLAMNMIPGVGPFLSGVHEGKSGANHKVLELLQKNGVNTDDTTELMRALRNDDLMGEIDAQAARYGLALGSVSVVSNALLQSVLAPVKWRGKTLTNNAREQINLGTQMFAQAGAEAGGEVTGMYAQRGEVSDISAKDAALEGLVGFTTAPVEVGAFAGKRYYQGMIQARRTEQADKSQAAYVSNAANSEMRKNDPESFKRVMDDYFAGTPSEFIQIPAAKLQELGQSANVDIPALLESVGIDQKHYDAQVSLGGSVQMQNSAYLAYLTDHDEFLRSSIRVAQNDMSMDDVKVWEKEEVARLEKMAENIGNTEPVIAAYSDILGQLMQNGIERSTAEQYAKTFSVAAARVAEQTGQTVQEFLAANPLNIKPKQPDQVKNIKAEELDLMLNRLRVGDVPKAGDMFGKSLVEQLTADGGVQDMGGELAALDADVGKVGRNRLTRPEGKTPDDAAMWAWERGYFPGVPREEVTPDLLVNAIRDEMAGTPRYSVDQENATLRDQADALNALQEHLDRSGYDLSQMDNAQILEALRTPQGEQSYSQDGTLKTDTKAFKEWFGDSKVVDADGKPLVVYHGTDQVLDIINAASGESKAERGQTVVGNTLYQPDGGEGSPDDNRGSITFGARKDGVREFNINLGQKSDKSTILHEFGHYYLEVIGDLVEAGKANESLTADYSEILKWFGVESRAQVGVDQHEQFARGFEKYLAEGKAPSIELQGAFARFKRWMIEIYKDLNRLNVELTPEIRGVFDRLLASEEAIAEAEQHETAVKDYEGKILALMGDEDKERYLKAVQAAHDEAVTEIEQEILRAEKRKEKEWYKAERDKVEAEVKADLEKLPAYQARKYLFGKTPHPQTGAILRMDAAATGELFGTKSKDARFLNTAKLKVGGLHPDAVAALLGFDNAIQMVTEMRSVANLSDAVKAETERQMADRYPNPMIDGTLNDKAAYAVGEKQSEVHAIQFRSLAKQVGRKASPQKTIREAARRHIAKLKLRDVVTSAFLRAATKSAREVEEALLAGDTIKAYEAKERQLMNMALAREAQAANELADQKREQAKAYTKKGAKRDRLQKASVQNFEVTYPGGRVEYVTTKAAADRAEAEGAEIVPLFNFLEQVDGLLRKYEFANVRGTIQKQRQSLVSFLQEMAEQGIVVNPSEWVLLDRAERTNWKDLTIEQLTDVVDMIRQIDQMAKNKLDILRGDKWMEFEPLRDEVVASVIANGSQAARLPFTRTYGEQLRKWGRQWLGMLPADQIARELDGQDDLGPVTKNITMPVQQAARQAVIREKAEHQELADLFNQFYSAKELKGLSETRIAVPEVGDSMTRMQMIMLLANLGNDGNREALLSQENGMWTAEVIQAVVSRLDQRDADFVEALWSWIDKFFPEIAELEARRTGVAPAKVQASQYPVKLADGKIRILKGGYFPLKYDGEVSIEAARDEAANAFQNMTAGRTAKAYTPEGHKIERVGSGGRPVKLDFSVVISHVSDVVRDIVMTDPVNQSWRFLHDKEVRGAFEKGDVKELWTALEIWIQDVAEGEQVSKHWMSGAARWLRTGFTANVMLFNIANSVMNLLGTHAIVVLGSKYAAIGYKDALVKSNWAQMYELSSYMREARVDSYNKDMTLVREQMENGAQWRRVMTAAGFYVHNQTQMMMDAVTWMGAYQKAQSLDLIGDDAVAYADQRVVEASGSGVFADRSALERGTFDAKTRQNELVRGLTMLSGYMIRKMAIARRRTGETNFSEVGQALGWAVDMSLLFTIEAMAYAFVKGNLPDDEDEDELAAAYAKSAAWETFNSVMGGLPPAGRPLASAVSGFGGGSSSYDVFSGQLSQLITQAEQGEIDKAALRAMAMTVGTITKTPGAATSRLIDWIDRNNNGDEAPWWEIFTGNRNK